MSQCSSGWDHGAKVLYIEQLEGALRDIKRLIEKNTPDDVNPEDAWWGAWDISRTALGRR